LPRTADPSNIHPQVEMDVAQLQLSCEVAFGKDIIVVQAEKSSLAGSLVLKKAPNGLASHAEFTGCKAVINLTFSGQGGWLIKEVDVGLLRALTAGLM
jgi:hypothetical protein